VPFALPDGLSDDALRKIFLSFSLDGGPVGQMDPYFYDAYFRFMHSWEAVRHERGRCLELGANPYFITWLLREHTELELTLANYFGSTDTNGRQTLSWDDGTARHEVALDFDHFNSEEARFPYEDGSFDVVVYCEIIEHLLMDPVHTLKEIRRVLKPGGKLLVTTPNVARFENLIALSEGRSIYDPYSGFGPYGRHNREYSMTELLHLLRFCGFSEEKSFTADAHDIDFSASPFFSRACRIAKDRPHTLGQYLFAIVRATEPVQDGVPGSLFRSYPEGHINFSW
jgi:SAM-dependent methyltransferase